MKNNPESNRHVLLFANGPYQFIIGIACILKRFPSDIKIDLIPYDMQWQKSLKDITLEFAQLYNVNIIHLPFEFLKSNTDNQRTYPLRSFVNHLLFIFYTKAFAKQYIFMPKMYGAPERAILLAAVNKKKIIYDDGFGQYVNPQVHLSKYDQFVYMLIGLKDHRKNNIFISPRNPSLVNFEGFRNVEVFKDGYTDELRMVLEYLNSKIQPRKTLEIYQTNKKTNVMISLPRISFIDKTELALGLTKIFIHFSREYPQILFLLKPHPRDVLMDFSDFSSNFADLSNCQFLPIELWCYPAELLCLELKPIAILSGTSTIGINSDLITSTKVMVFDFLSFNLPGYSEEAKEIMVNAGNHLGITAEDAIYGLVALLTTSSPKKDMYC